MFNHAAPGYRCPFCLVAKGEEADFLYTRQADVIYRDADITAFISSHWWPSSKAHVLIVTNRHVENLYDMPVALLSVIHAFSRKVAIALKEVYGCEGVSIRQHNEPAGNQDVWHYHLHVFPRYPGDDLYRLNDQKMLSTPEERLPFAEKLRDYLADSANFHAHEPFLDG